jgi:immunoglobulin-binding protein 1
MNRSEANEDQRGMWEEMMWKIDAPSDRGPLLDAQGKVSFQSLALRFFILSTKHPQPLRSFTLLPSGTPDRTRLQDAVFGPGYNLPTMTIDEYLEIEKARGGIIQGGGYMQPFFLPASILNSICSPQTGLTESEQLLVDSEQDGTIFGEQKAEEKRLKDEKWAQFTDANPRGAGNTMNRG